MQQDNMYRTEPAWLCWDPRTWHFFVATLGILPMWSCPEYDFAEMKAGAAKYGRTSRAVTACTLFDNKNVDSDTIGNVCYKHSRRQRHIDLG